MLNFLKYGLLNLPWWGYLLVTLTLTHITILAVTIFLHRHQAHRALDLHPIISHFFRFWLWLTTGMVTREWAAVHRKHHAFADKPGDPHSPQIFGLKQVFWQGTELYQAECKNVETLEKYGNGTPNDWLERNLYTKYSYLGVIIMLGLNLTLFGPIGLSMWAIQMLWIPISAAGIINGIGHFWGYKNFPGNDSSKNMFPFGFLIGGEELHNNHHTFGTSAKLSYKWYEFDLGWMWIRILELCKLATVKKTIPNLPKAKAPKTVPDYQTLEVIISNRYNLMMQYAKMLKQDCKREMAKFRLNFQEKISWNKLKLILAKDQEMLTNEEKSTMQKIASQSQLLKKAFALRADLTLLWQRSNLTKEELLKALQNWCTTAENSGIKNLKVFSLHLKASY